MALAHRWSSRNLTRLELTFALLIIALMLGTFSARILALYAAAEERAVQATVVNINTALRMYLYQLVIEGRLIDAVQWGGANPMALIEQWGRVIDAGTLEKAPELAGLSAVATGFSSRYLGEFDDPDLATVEGGQWYFDRRARALVYRVQNTEFFRSALKGPARIRFRVALQFDDENNDGEYNSESDALQGAALKPMENFYWIEVGGGND